MGRPAPQKNSRISGAVGAAPVIISRTRPPNAARIFSKTIFSATLYCSASQAGTGRPSTTYFTRRRPTPSAQAKIFCTAGGFFSSSEWIFA